MGPGPISYAADLDRAVVTPGSKGLAVCGKRNRSRVHFAGEERVK
jgi:hypothetical protein